MGRSKCNIIRDMLPLYIDDVVCADTREWVEKHTSGCAECAAVLDGMRKAAVIPPETDIDVLRRFKKRINWGRMIAALAAAAAVLAAMVCVGYWLCWVEIIEYDGSNIEVYETDSGYGLMARYNGKGNVDFGFSTNVDKGVSSLVVTQVRWKRYIEPLYRYISPEIYLTNTYDTLRVEMQTSGETLWEADAKQQEMYYEKRAAEAEE